MTLDVEINMMKLATWLRALRNMQTTIKDVLRETEHLTQSIQAGNLATRGHAEKISRRANAD